MNLLFHFLLSICFSVSVGFFTLPAFAETPLSASMVKQTAEKAVEVRRESQKLADGWAKEAADLQTEIEILEQELETVKWRREKTARYMKDLENKMTALKAKEQAAREIRNELEPFLDQTLQELQAFSENDLPMLAEMQTSRLHSVAAILNNADANIVQKTRSLLEAASQALEYGYFSEPDEAEIDIDGNLIRVQRLNVGRLALFALSGDARDAWKWNRETSRYEPIPHFARSIQEVIQITERSRLVSLVELPIGPAKERTEEISQ
jgi:hypothetical protein